MKNFVAILRKVTEAQEDAEKFFEKGNRAAGTRLRKVMQEVKVLAQTVRKEVSAVKNED